MKSARFLRMVETNQGVGFLYQLSEPFYGSHHMFVTQGYFVYPCGPKAQIETLIPWLAPEANSIPEIFEDFGYMTAT